MRSARVKGAWMSTGGSDCSIVVFWCSKEKSSRGTVVLCKPQGRQRLVPCLVSVQTNLYDWGEMALFIVKCKQMAWALTEYGREAR